MANWDELIEQIAFGQEKPKAAPSLGLYLSPDTIYLAESHLSGGKLVVDHLVRIPIPPAAKTPGATATMNTDFLNDPQKIAGLVRQSMAQLRWNSKNVRVTLSHHLGLLRYFSMPAMERRFLKSAVPLEAKKYIPIPFDVLAHDFQSMPLPTDAGGRQRLGILIAVTQSKNIANIQGLVESLGLKLEGVEVAPCSVLRLWQSIDPPKGAAPFAHVHIDGGNVRVMVSEHGVPVFFREVFLSGDATLADMRKIDLAGCLAFIQKQLGIPGVSRVRVSGGIPNLGEFVGAFSAEAGVEAGIQETAKLLSVKSGDWGGYAALGASAHALVSTPMTLDVAAQGRVTDDERQVARDILVIGAAAALFLSGSGLVKNVSYTMRRAELRKYNVAADIKTLLSTKTPTQIDVLLGDMQKQSNQLKLLAPTADRPKLSAILREVIVNMPEKVWITQLSATDSLENADHAPFLLSLRGRAQDATVAAEQELALRFKDNLLKSPMFSRNFDIQITIQKEMARSGGGGMDRASLAATLEGRTQFTLEIMGKR